MEQHLPSPGAPHRGPPGRAIPAPISPRRPRITFEGVLTPVPDADHRRQRREGWREFWKAVGATIAVLGEVCYQLGKVMLIFFVIVELFRHDDRDC